MKATRQRRRTAVEALFNCNVNTGTRTKTSTKKALGRRHNAAGKSDAILIEKDENPSPSSTVQALSQHLPVKGTGFSETMKGISSVELELGQALQSCTKIKLQLFPIDERTRIGLEKDGHNPYLELTLRAQKKISSVLKHLNRKWGNSNIAVGDLMLFPYSICLENLADSGRWTLKDGDTSATDVYEAIGRPTIFRLRYGWFSNLEPKTFSLPLASTCFKDFFQSEDINKSSSTCVEIRDGEKEPCEDNPQTVNGLMPSSIAWADGLTDISMGGMLSEVSLQGIANPCDPVPTGSASFLPQIPFSSDSFDAAIAALIHDHPRGPKPSSHGPHASILDAEETCHAFPFKKLSSLGEEVPTSSKSAPSVACGQDAGSKPFKFLNLAEARSEAGLPQGDVRQEPKSDLLPHTRGVDNGESSIGLSGINWTDSLGPLEFGLSSSRQIIGGDSISLSGLLASSIDAFQSRSFFARDGKVPPT